MKKKGFTLIELLAVIVILAIIALIAVPIIMNIIDRSKGGVYDRQRDMVAKSAELYYFKYNDELVWEDDISYVEIGRLKETGYLREKILNPLNNQEIPDETKVLIYKEDGIVKYSLQLYDNDSFKWYQQKMVASVKDSGISLPTETGEKTTIDLNTLIDEGKVAEIRIPTNLTSRCVGYVDIEKVDNDNYTYDAYVDCLLDASTFASHYVSYGGKYLDEFNDVKETTDGGYIAVGSSNSEVITKYGNEGKGNLDAIIVKFDSIGNVEWSRNFGGSNDDVFLSVIPNEDGYVAVGSTSSNDNDVAGLYRGGISDGLIVEFDTNGNVVYKRSYGGSGEVSSEESFTKIIKDGDYYILVGYVYGTNKDGDLEGTDVSSNAEGIVLKMNSNYDTVWRTFFKGSYSEIFNNVIKVSDGGYVVVGYSNSNNLDMSGVVFDGGRTSEAIIIKYDNLGNYQYKSIFAGNSSDSFYDVLEVDNGYVVAGMSRSTSVDMEDISKAYNGKADAIIVKYDKNLENIMWKKSFGGTENDAFYSVIKDSPNEVIVVGYSQSKDMDMDD